MKGSKFLKVTGILMLVSGAAVLVIGLIGLGTVGLLSAAGVNSSLFWVSAILGLLGAVAELIAGVAGIKNADKPEKAGVCITWGVVVVVFCLISQVLTLANYPENFNFASLILGFAVPVLYLIGAFMNKKNA